MPVYRRPLRSYELYHSGVKGMKWGVRNGPPYPINRNKTNGFPVSLNIKSKAGFTVKSISQHVKDQAVKRNVKSEDIVDAIMNPLYIRDVKYDPEGRPSHQFIGEKATASINPLTGNVSSVWPTGHRLRKKYSRKK